ncbi:uncharacterized protein B0I36DRAFT_152648 [Microdochium trichocladiopsis]|uniref:DUF6536 domain-containing protein n=1 Tax=Microdochium trichocladiopsis TaxID=1682393 RepID=A0A9P9BM74_9PEZI|nr:uncharacterized protein B0I36DRAFT_152648 [Microdochium trichocladiopsis]KAH7026005.1 hypothetical protein B0I36DRAFT_152648 [Microdochium trichocladiopsis]
MRAATSGPVGCHWTDTEPPSTATHSRRTKSSVAWPFHTRNASEAASTTLSMKMRSSWNPRNLLRMADDNVSISRSIVPDYILHYMAGETPESLAQKRQEREEDERRGDAHLLRRRDSLTSTPVEFVDLYSSSTDLTRGIPSSSRSHRSRYLSGWRGGLRLNAVLVGIVFAATLGCLLGSVARTKSVSGDFSVFSGSCSAAKQTSIGIHVAINIATIGLLAAANYALQVLSSPSRVEIDIAHAKRQWLDIGIPSVRNFKHISPVRSVLAAAAIICAAAGQVIYNGVIFETRGLNGPDSCGIHVSTPLLLVGAALSFVVLLCTCAAFILPHFDPIITIGDAIRSFLRIQDPTTTERCLMTKLDVKRGRWANHEARYFARGRHWWFLSPSFTRWFLTALAFLAVAAPATVAVIVMVNSDVDEQFPPFGTATRSTTFVFPPFSSDSTVPRIVLAALPHLLLAILYLSANAIFTCYYLSHEFSLFARERQQLRVSSNPVSAQTSTLYLTLPRPVSWCLLALFAAMGVIMSQSVFPIMNPTSSEVNNPNGDVQIGLSSVALVALLGLLGLLLLVILGMGFRRAQSAAVGDEGAIGNPLALAGGSCSAVISSRCHGRSDEDGRGALSWGVTEEARGMTIGHCAFSRRDVGIVEGRGLYA